METKERIKRFKGGETISSIAGAAGVSRAAIIQSLKRADVYEKGIPGRPKVKDVEVKDYSVPTYDIKEEVSDEGLCKVMGNVVTEAHFLNALDKEYVLFANIKISTKGCRVFDWSLNRDWVLYPTFAALVKVYG